MEYFLERLVGDYLDVSTLEVMSQLSTCHYQGICELLNGRIACFSIFEDLADIVDGLLSPPFIFYKHCPHRGIGCREVKRQWSEWEAIVSKGDVDK